jgi:hypothetical protein
MTDERNDSERNDRRVHHWRGEDRQADIAALADAIAASANNLFNHDGALVQVDEGELPVNFADFCSLVDRRICGVRAVRRDGGWWKEYFSYRFPPAARPDPTRGGLRPPPDKSEPDAAVLDQLYRVEVLSRVPKVEA